MEFIGNEVMSCGFPWPAIESLAWVISPKVKSSMSTGAPKAVMALAMVRVAGVWA